MKNTIAGLVAALVIILGIVVLNEHQVSKSMTAEEKTEFAAFREQVRSLKEGDIVLRDGETYMVSRTLGPTVTLTTKEGKVLVMNPTNAKIARRDSEEVQAIVKRGQEGWEPLATWYFIQ